MFYKNIRKVINFRSRQPFLDPSANKGDIIDAGEQLMLSITGTIKKEKTMDEKFLADYYKKLGGKSAVRPESLGPTLDATVKHQERVYHTVQFGAEMIYHLNNGDGKCRMGCAYLCK